MEINPGGIIDPKEFIGRKKEISRYWKVLTRQGLVLSAERRIGKTSLVRKMQADGKPGFVVFYQDVENVHSIIELVTSVYNAVQRSVSSVARIRGKFVSAWAALMPVRFKEIELPQARDRWKSLLAMAINDVISHLEADDRAIFIWDEFPLMLHKLAKNDGPQLAIELLDQLRHLRQVSGGRLRFLLTGSVGLHLVLRQLRIQGNTNSPVNDMCVETMPPMIKEEALELARSLVGKMMIVPADPDAIAVTVVEAVQGFPYYIHHVVDQLDQFGREVAPPDVTRVVDDLVRSSGDPANLAYFQSRIASYYEPRERQLALEVLDVLASESVAPNFARMANRVRHSITGATDEEILMAIQLLREDHYIDVKGEGKSRVYDFRWSLLKQWWKENRK